MSVEELLHRIRATGVGASANINPFWQAELKKLATLIGSDPNPSLAALRQAIGYGDKRLPDGVASNRDLPTWADVKVQIRNSARAARGEQSKHSEHIGALVFLKRQKTLKAYLRLIDVLRLRSNMGLARHYWYSLRLQESLKETRKTGKLNFIELGAGAGQFAMLMARSGYVRNYVIVDLPEMLIASALNIGEMLPLATIHVNEAPKLANSGLHVWFFDTKAVEGLPAGCMDVALNFNSLMEMDEGVRNYYIEQIYRICRHKALFYNVNRRQHRMTRLDGSPFDSNPLLYPYRRTDRVLEWEPDRFQETYRSRLYGTPSSFCISRIAEIRHAVSQPGPLRRLTQCLGRASRPTG